jgi:hypothetical protein
VPPADPQWRSRSAKETNTSWPQKLLPLQIFARGLRIAQGSRVLDGGGKCLDGLEPERSFGKPGLSGSRVDPNRNTDVCNMIDCLYTESTNSGWIAGFPGRLAAAIYGRDELSMGAVATGNALSPPF